LAGGFILGLFHLCFSRIPPIHTIFKEHPEVQSRPYLLSSVDALAPRPQYVISCGELIP
jgi:hypothetical protein